MDLYLLTALQPRGHLTIFILVIGCAKTVLCKINMESLCLLCVVVVRGPKKAD
jgi:hypothetical protein